MIYPKTYGRLVEIVSREEEWPFKDLRNPIYVFEEVIPIRDSKKFEVIRYFQSTHKTIRANYPRRTGHSKPTQLVRVKVKDKRGKVAGYQWRRCMVGMVFKLFQRPEDGGRWSYRWLGR
jgi:hypothetical protein